MPAYNFQKRFAAKVESGEKLHTIRAIRKDGKRPMPHTPMAAYFGMRTKGCRLLVRSVISRVEHVRIDSGGIVQLDGRQITHAERDALALADGFVDAREFVSFFRDNHGLPFEGHLIHWHKLPYIASQR